MIHNNYIVYTLHDAGNGKCGLYTKWTICRLRLVHNDYMTWGLHTKIYDLHVTDVITWRLYHLHNFELRAWYNTLPNRDCEHGVLHSQNYRLWLCFLTSFIYVWISFLCIFVDIAFWVSLQLSFYLCPHISCVDGLHNLQSFTNCHSFHILNWDPHACRGQGMFFYYCYTCKQILIIVLKKMPSF